MLSKNSMVIATFVVAIFAQQLHASVVESLKEPIIVETESSSRYIFSNLKLGLVLNLSHSLEAARVAKISVDQRPQGIKLILSDTTHVRFYKERYRVIREQLENGTTKETVTQEKNLCPYAISIQTPTGESKAIFSKGIYEGVMVENFKEMYDVLCTQEVYKERNLDYMPTYN